MSYSNAHLYSYFYASRLCQLHLGQLSQNHSKTTAAGSNSAARLVFHRTKFHRTQPLPKELHWQRCIYKLLIIVWKTLHGQGQQYLHDLQGQCVNYTTDTNQETRDFRRKKLQLHIRVLL